ncbi:sensor histidine kinase [Amycolatopsis sp. lyj-112]|uniref:sensor histidine kinase n=1 Tax=Amycolatopsis sp. lyj-112 TaxID=2789288 RepID=UPI00397A8F9B
MRNWRIPISDWAIAIVVAGFLVTGGLFGKQPGTGLAPLGYALLVASGVALAAYRKAPITVLAATALFALGYQAIGFDVPTVAFLVAVYGTMRAGHRIATVAGAVLMLAGLPLALLASPDGWTVGEAFTHSRDALQIAWLIAAGAAGEALRQTGRRAVEAERTREETALRRAGEERLHIARELHDSLTHQISVIKVQAEAAVHVATKQGEPVPQALLAIREAGREATRELRATLEALRDDDKNPPLGLAHLPDLVQRARTTGLDAKLTIEGRQPALPATVDRTAYRIVQESLTNIARHAAATTASVRIEHRPELLTIRIDDDGQATPGNPPVPGVGLLGMRERITALGGHLRAEPRIEGGFSVQAELPVERTS